MQESACSLLWRDRDVVVNLKGDLDGFQTFEQVFDLMPPVKTVNRIVFDCSTLARAKTEEVYYMLAELAANPRFIDMEIVIQGLQWNMLDARM